MMTLQMPRGFQPADHVEAVEFAETPAFARGVKRARGAKAKGLRYEKQVQEFLGQECGNAWEAKVGPWFRFEENGRERYAQADWLGLNCGAQTCLLVEIKLTRVPKAWWQLNRLYRPLVEYLYPGWQVAMLEISDKVAHFEGMEQVKVVDDFRDAVPGRTSYMRVPYGRRG